MKQPIKSKVFRWLLVAMGILVIVYFVKVYFFPETLKSAAMKILVSIEKGDSDVLINYILEDEKNAAGVNKKTLKQFMNNFYLPKLAGFKRSASSEERIFPDQAILQVGQKYKHPDGRATELSIATTLTENDGIKYIGLISSLLITGIFADFPSDKPLPQGLERTLYIADAIDENLEALEATGIVGFYTGLSDKRQFYTWKEYRDYLYNEYEKRKNTSDLTRQ